MEHYYGALHGFFWFEEAYRRLLNSLPTDQPSHFVELGSFAGKSAAWLGVEIVNSRKPVTLHCVDSFEAWEGMPQGAELRAMFDTNTAPIKDAMGDRFKVWQGLTTEVAKGFADESVEVVWVDAGHTYEECSADIKAWWPKVKPLGWMGGDDWMMSGVCQAVIEHFAPYYMLGHGWTTNPESRPWPWWIVRKPPP